MKTRVALLSLSVWILAGFLSNPVWASDDDHGIKNGTIRIQGQSKAEFPYMAKLDIKQAMDKALEKVEGRILEVEFENQGGFLILEVEVVRKDTKTIKEVIFDAGTGDILAIVDED